MAKPNKIFQIIPQSTSETQEKSVSPSTSEIEVIPDSGKLLSKVTIGAVTSSIDQNIVAGNIKNNVEILGVTGSLVSKLPSVINDTETVINAEDLAGVSSLRNHSFDACTSLRTVTLPNEITIIGNNAFYGCNNLETAPLPSSLERVGQYAFYNCSKLTSLVIPAGVTFIGSYAFRGCNKLTSIIIYATDPPQLDSVNAFGNTGSGPIYVPKGCLEDYLKASNWSNFSGRLQEIP